MSPVSAVANRCAHAFKASQSGSPGHWSSTYIGYHHSSRVTALWVAQSSTQPLSTCSWKATPKAPSQTSWTSSMSPSHIDWYTTWLSEGTYSTENPASSRMPPTTSAPTNWLDQLCNGIRIGSDESVAGAASGSAAASVASSSASAGAASVVASGASSAVCASSSSPQADASNANAANAATNDLVFNI